MRKLILAAAPLLSLALAAPAFSQGATQSPPSPNSANSMPEPPNSLPSGARSLTPGETGLQREGNIQTTRVGPGRHHRHRHRRNTPRDTPMDQTVPDTLGR